jgi:hypothetical protein
MAVHHATGVTTMALAELALTIYLTADVERPAAGAVGIAVLVAIATLELAVMIAFSRIGRSGGSDDDQDEGGDDPGWGREGPRTPPPDAPVCWPEFERQFAEHVAALAERDRQVPATSSSRRGRRAFDVRPERNVASAHAKKQAAPAAVVQFAAARSSSEPDEGTT